MLNDCQFWVTDFRYTIGWITMKMNPFTSLLRFVTYTVLAFLRLNLIERLLEALNLDTIGYKFKKTFIELIVIEAQTKKVQN
jgi:hypothetical protein